LGHLHKPSIQALIHGLNRHYYSLGIAYRKHELEERMLLNLHKKRWSDGFALERFDARGDKNAAAVGALRELAIKYDAAVVEEATLSKEKLAIVNVGRQDAKKHLEDDVAALMGANIVQTLGAMLDVVVF
jgi:26S proteasome regulatory subunit N11